MEAIKYERPVNPSREQWEEYGARKAEIVAVAGSTEEYDQMMKELLDELGL